MDTIRFSVEKADRGEAGSTVAIWINGRNFLEIVRDFEMPFAIKEGHPNMAGQYAQLPPADIPDLWSHFHDDTLPYFSEDNKIYLFVCGCGTPGCWPLQAYIDVDENTVIWSDLEQPHRREYSRASHWRYDELGPFVFDRDQYEEALKSLP